MYKIFQEALNMKHEAENMLNHLDGTDKRNDIYIDLSCKAITQANIIIEAYKEYVAEVIRVTPKPLDVIKEKETFKIRCINYIKKNILEDIKAV